MYLKSIEIQGFKSFAHKSVLKFDHSLTAIVGPNGSGKSNIADAVRWAIGEQSVKTLRGAEMQDVIFSGTELRRPQGMAAVSVTLDNADHALNSPYAEITVQRRLFRSGESEYLINSEPCRLRDIEELFFDTGVGREGYSIIGQGRVETILSGKPEERRGLLDEAAGIVRFKARKKEALRKLSSERANLERVRDVLSELELRLAPLKRQQESARTYLSLRDEMKKLELNLFIRESGDLTSELNKARNDKSIVEDSLRELEEEKESLFSYDLTTELKLKEFNKLIEDKKEEITRARLLRQNLLGQISVRETEIRAYGESLSGLQNDKEAIEREVSDNVEKGRALFDALSTLEGEITGLRADDLKAGGENLSEIDRISQRIKGFKEKLYFCIEPGIAPSAETPDKEEDEDTFLMPEWLKNITDKRNKLSEIRERELKNLKWQEESGKEYNILTGKLKELREKYNQKQKAYLDLKARHDSLKDFSERYEGFGESVKAVMNIRERIGGIRGVAADILSTDKRYELAIEAALGNRIQNIVVDSEADAKEVIAYLKRTKKGRVTLLPLDKIGGSTSTELRKAAEEPGSLGIASDLVSFDSDFINAVKYLLGGVMVAEDIDKALRIADKYHHRLRIVTLEGDLITPGGAVTGGAYRNSLNLMGRKSRLDELKEQILAKKEDMAKSLDEISSLEKAVGDKTRELQSIGESLRAIDLEKQELSLSIVSDARIKTGEFSQKADFIEESIEGIVSTRESFGGRKEALKEKEAGLRDKISEAENDIAERNEDILSIDKGIAADEEAIRDTGEKRDALSGKETERYQRKEEISGEILELNKELLRIDALIEKRSQKIEEDAAYILDEYGIKQDEAVELYDESLGGARGIRARLNTIRDTLRELGPINIEAIEEYREVNKRYDFLKAQEEDLTESEKTVLNAIDELDKRMRDIFGEQFNLINEAFGKVFGELFDGGRAMLSLSDEDELEAGITIFAEPPGKKLKNIMQLSGGERALTAIALLFAIQSLKPSPFCLLDEIEANLDDVNVMRFARYLKRLSVSTQFICITHKRGTMEAAERLYGITMQERGVSKLVSVDLVSDELS